jgi:DNA-binding protein Fis
MQQYDELGFLNINLLFHVHRAMIQVQDVVSVQLNFYWIELNFRIYCNIYYYIICQSANPVLNGVCLWCHGNIPECKYPFR